ncbi:hypothetical protein Dsin_006625 [Dipteronia sinensis]|uniref:SWIM-type domain-containing protein n=1 Tax=Dipteronia sinensis TaxID=43782 RepID=A0AAE0EFR2_9ROSI|nr:hypothetical protein Dsin_006625 [Dipteronia sinensis]
MFEDHGLDTIVFELENAYVPNPPGDDQDEEPEVLAQDCGYQPLGWHDLEAEMLNYDGDSEKDDDKDDGNDGDSEAGEDKDVGNDGDSEAGEGKGSQVPIVNEDADNGNDRNDDIINECMDLFEGYQSKSDDEYFSDSELELDKGVILKRVKNDNVRQTYKCLGDGCHWRAHGSRMIDKMTFMIKTLVDEHECHRVYNNKEAKVKWIASKFENLVKTNPSVSVKVIGDLLRENYRVSVDVQRLYNAKRRALAGLAKDHAKCFGLLRRYAYMVNQSNPGSAVHICTQQPQPTFQRMFLSFEAQKLGFLEDCRPFIGVDGCHLKGPFGGVLLSAVALDANSGLFPLAVCICEKENQTSWEWFLNNLKIHLKYLESRNLTFMSDRQKCVIAALELHFPFAKRRYCARHIFANFRLTYKGEHYKKLFWRATRSCNVFDFNEAMNEIGAIDPAAKSWLQNIDNEHWSRFAYDQIIRYDHVTNNMTEAFNSMLGSHRAASYLELLEFIRRMVMRKFQERKEECEAWNSVLPPRVNAKILKHGKESRLFTIIAAGNGEYELLGPTGGYGVKLREYSCQCGYWQMSEIPCTHAMAAISHYCGKSVMKDKISDFVHQSLSKSAYLQTYRGMIHPIPDQKRWPKVPACLPIEGQTEHLIPPPRTVQPGRLKTQRKREPDEPPKGGRSGTVVCKLCSEPGHNQRTCKKKKTTQTQSSSQPSTSQPPTTQSQPHSQVLN